MGLWNNPPSQSPHNTTCSRWPLPSCSAEQFSHFHLVITSFLLPQFLLKGEPGSTHRFTQHHSSCQSRASFPTTLSPETLCLIPPAASADVSFDTECKVSTLTCTELLCLRGLQVGIHKSHKSTNPTHGAAQSTSWALTSLFQCHQRAQWL